MAKGRNLKREEILDNFTRGKIYAYISANPGTHYNKIKEELGINNGTVDYHLNVLERTGYVRSGIDGSKKVFFKVDSNERDT